MEAFRPKRFINCYVPTQACNFRCSYCYIGQKKTFDNQMFHCQYSLETMKKATSKERLGGICIFNLCAGGETLLGPDIIPVIKMLLENGHNVSVVSNGTITSAFDEILKFPKELLDFLYIKFSFHLFELERTDNMDILVCQNGVQIVIPGYIAREQKNMHLAKGIGYIYLYSNYMDNNNKYEVTDAMKMHNIYIFALSFMMPRIYRCYWLQQREM